MTSTNLIFARSGSAVPIGREIARGGEGAVHILDGAADKLIKLYLKPPDPAKCDKLKIMSAGTSDALTKVAAWPIDLVTDRQGRTLGFMMPRATAATEAHELYTPKSRTQTFPEADFRFILLVATNIVRAFGTVHQQGYVIGDVNHGQVLVGSDARVTLIDCDSFQVDFNGRLYTCDVGVPLFTPPELQSRSFRGLHRTTDHDRFGLAVIIFQMLFMGRHPYAGVPLDPNQSSEIEAAIKADRFAYGRDRRARGVEQPPGALPLTTYGPGVASLFERAFAPQPITSRPDAAMWLEQLKALQGSLKACSANEAHHYPGQNASCPWCAIEARTGTRLFGYKLKSDLSQKSLDVAALWGAVVSIPDPPQYPPPNLRLLEISKRSSAEQDRLWIKKVRQLGATIIAAGTFLTLAELRHPVVAVSTSTLFAVMAWPRNKRADIEAATKAEADARTAYEDVERTWKAAAAGLSFKRIRQQCYEAKLGLDQLPAEQAKRFADLKSEAKQRESYLDGFRIDKEKIPGIGPSRIAALSSFGIETAWDVTPSKVQAIPGFGPATADKLLTWRKSKEVRFRFNANHPIAAAELNLIKAELNAKAQKFATVLRNGPHQLTHASNDASYIIKITDPILEQNWLNWQLAKRHRDDFYSVLDGNQRKFAIICLILLYIIALWWALSISGSHSTATPIIPAAQVPVPVVSAPTTRAPKPNIAKPPSALSIATTNEIAPGPELADNNTESAPEASTSQNELDSTALSPPAFPIPERNAALSRAVAEALNTGLAEPWNSDGMNGTVTVGEPRYYAGKNCRSFAYSWGHIISQTHYACQGTDRIWRPEESFATKKQ